LFFTLKVFLSDFKITLTQACLKALSKVSRGLFHKLHQPQLLNSIFQNLYSQTGIKSIELLIFSARGHTKLHFCK